MRGYLIISYITDNLGLIGVILGLYWGYIRNNGKENGNCYILTGYILGLYGENGKEDGNYFNGIM